MGALAEGRVRCAWLPPIYERLSATQCVEDYEALP